MMQQHLIDCAFDDPLRMNFARALLTWSVLFPILLVLATENYYSILEVDENASLQQIKKSYRKLALKHHPDRNKGGEDEATLRFQKVSEAFEVLSDEEKRREYDASLRGPPRQQYQQNTYNQPDPRQQYEYTYGGGRPGYYEYEYQRPQYTTYSYRPHRDPYAQFSDFFQHDPFFAEEFENMEDMFGFDDSDYDDDDDIFGRAYNAYRKGWNSRGAGRARHGHMKREKGWQGWMDTAAYKLGQTVKRMDRTIDKLGHAINRLFSSDDDEEEYMRDRWQYFSSRTSGRRSTKRNHEKGWKRWLSNAKVKASNKLDDAMDKLGNRLGIFLGKINAKLQRSDTAQNVDNALDKLSNIFGKINTKLKLGDLAHKLDNSVEKLGKFLGRILFGEADDESWEEDSSYTSKSSRTNIQNGVRITIQTFHIRGNRIEERYVDGKLVERFINGVPEPIY